MYNYSVNIILPQVKPYLYVKDNQIYSKFKVGQELMGLMPTFKNNYIGTEYIIGTKNKSGHYNGMIGSLEREDIDAILYPLPIDMIDPPGIFSSVFWESSTYIISLTSLPSNKHLDISSSLLNLDFQIIILNISSFLILSLFTYKVLKLFSNFCEALFTFFCLTLKQDSRINFNKNFRSFFLLIVLYHFIMTTFFEISVNSNLIIRGGKDLINTIDDLYNRKDLFPFFIKDHFTINYFISPYSNQKMKKIFQRTSECKDCILTLRDHGAQALLYKNISFETKAFIFDRSMKNVFKNFYCSSNHEKINSLGSFHRSLPIIKNYFALLLSKKINLNVKLIVNKRLVALCENSIFNKLFDILDQTSFLDFKEYSVSYKKCLNEYNINSFKNSYEKIKWINISISITVFFIFSSLYLFLFLLNFLMSQNEKKIDLEFN